MLVGKICLESLVLVCLVLLNGSLTLTVNASEPTQRVSMACSFLSSLYNPSLHLVAETRSSHNFHIASDNLLAQEALRECMPNTSLAIQAALDNATCCRNGHDLMHETLLGAPVLLPFPSANVYNVTDYWNLTFRTGVGSYTVNWENHNGTGILSPFAYADVASYAVLEFNRRGNQTGVSETVQVLNTMWDGRGMVDEPFKTGSPSERGLYQTFKAALYLTVLTRLSLAIPAGVTEAILRMQGNDGGFHTGYDSNSGYGGTDENTETTSIAIIALREQATSPNWAYVAIVLGGTITLLAGLVFLSRHSNKQT